MSTETLAQRFWEDGYILLENFFSPWLMDALNELIIDHFGSDPSMFHTYEFMSKAKTEVIPWFPQEEGPSAFDEIEAEERLNQLTEQLLGARWQKLYCMVMFSKQGTVGQAWHQDCPPDRPAFFNLNRLVYTTDIREKIGGEVMVIPGSHKRGEISVGDPNEVFQDQKVLRPRKGSLILLHGHTWHRVGAIKSGFRFSINYRSMPECASPDITDTCVYRNMRYSFSSNSMILDRTQELQ